MVINEGGKTTRRGFFVLVSLLLTANAWALYGHISHDTTWADTVMVTGDVVVDSGVTLTINPGTLIKLRPDSSLWDDSLGLPRKADLIIDRGRIKANGTESQNIVFTTTDTNLIKIWNVAWGFIKTYHSTGDSLRYVNIHYGAGGFRCTSSQVFMDNIRIDSVDYGLVDTFAGIYCTDRSIVQLENSFIKMDENNLHYFGSISYFGFYAQGVDSVSISNCSIVNCIGADGTPDFFEPPGNGYGIFCDSVRYCSFTNNKIDTCAGGYGGGEAYGVRCENCGYIIIDSNNITFCKGREGATSMAPSPGGYGTGIFCQADSARLFANIIENCAGGVGGFDMMGGDQYSGGYGTGIWCNNLNHGTIENNRIDTCIGAQGGDGGNGIGLRLDNFSGTISRNIIFGCRRGTKVSGYYKDGQGDDVYISGTSTPTISGSPDNQNDFHKTDNYCVANYTPNDIVATYNWWGTTDSTTIEKYIFDKADSSVLGRVIFDPWADTALAVGEKVVKTKMEIVKLTAFPNPFSRTVKISSEYPGASSEGNTLKIYDPTGRLVKSFYLTPQTSLLTATGISWDGRDDAGKALPAGVYFCELQARTNKITKKLVLVR